ncbi:hypothetical protein [Methanolobus profundi]|uniref:Uncharacterized protein n=1 Tax=Methanolobus profundi TaxID=487685 RepID=A0A1I4PC72_9EURY|nr:hypothetical protein [Methanolobus profundi]SFM25434.1 hypothetical protein SAMN04488696_0573 [Methanolobus profundi]
MKKTSRHIPSFFYIIALIVLFSSFLPLAVADNYCPCNDLDTCVEWVDEGSVSIKWGEVKTVDVNGVLYTFRADDFTGDLDAALISIENDGVVRKEFLFLDVYDRMSFEWDNEVMVLLEDITTDSYKTPSAKIAIYYRGIPELDIEFDASEETIQGVDVSSEQYAPGEEKTIEVEVTNTGDAWIEGVVLEIPLGELRLREKGEFQVKDNIIQKNLGCLEVDDSVELNFTVVAPEWDGKTSPYDINYFLNATAVGDDIKGDEHEFNGSLELTCTDPDMEVLLELTKDEINMTSWYVEELESGTDSYSSNSYEIRDATEFVFLRTHIYNTGLYTIDDLDVQFSEIPEDIVISEAYDSGDHSSMDANGQYYLGQKLIGIRSGKYSFDSVIVTADIFGEEMTWKSGTESLTIHGPHIVVDKDISGTGNDYAVSLTLNNDGDRAAWINLTDSIPANVTYVSGSVEKGLAGSSLPLSEWDLSTSRSNDSYTFSVEGVLLPPGSSLSMSYDVSSDTALYLPSAVCEFRAIGDYEGEVRSSFYVEGNEVKQYWKPLNGGWVTDENALDDVVVVQVEPEKEFEDEDDIDEDILYSSDEEILDTSDVSLEVQQESSDTSFFSAILDPLTSMFDKVQQFVGNTFDSVINGVLSLFGVVENSAIDAVENYLYVVIILIAVAVFGVVYTLISK